MSLLERVAAARQGPDAPAAPTPPTTTSPAPSPVAGGPATTIVPRSTTPAAPSVAGTPPDAPHRRTSREEALRDLGLRLQDEAIDAGTTLLALKHPEDIRDALREILDRLTLESAISLTRDERLRLIDTVFDEITGLGPMEPLLADRTITEVMVNGPRQVYIERGGKLERIDVFFQSEEHVRHIIERIIAPLGRRIDESSPRVDARLPDGSRVNAIIKPLSLVGPVITIRKFSATPYTVDDLIRFGTATAEMFEFLRVCIEARLNVFLSGGTGSGKTTTLNVLSSYVPEGERIITIEDAAELQLKQKHVVTLEARVANLEGRGEITIRDLLRNALHMRPDRIIVGECRAGEALDMIQAMTTGHDGSMSTGHANSPRDMLRRLETMILMTGYELPMRAIREQIASAVDVIVHTARLRDGSRKIVSITEVLGIEDDEILTQEIFSFRQTDFRNGRVEGQLEPTGVRPTFMPLFAVRDIPLPPGEFGIPPDDPKRPVRSYKARLSFGSSARNVDAVASAVGRGRVTMAGGMVYVSSVGPVDLKTGQVRSTDIVEQTRQCLRNLRIRLEAAGSSLGDIVWANWALREPSDFDAFSEEWLRWFPGDGPIGQGTLLPPTHRRAGFRISIGVIAAGSDGRRVGAGRGSSVHGEERRLVPMIRPGRSRQRRRRLAAVIPVEASKPEAPPVAPADAVEADGDRLPLGAIDPELYARYFPEESKPG